MKEHKSISKVAGLNVSSNIALQDLPVGDGKACLAFLEDPTRGDERPGILKPLILRRGSEGREIFAHFLTASGYYLRYEFAEFIIKMGEKIGIYCYPKNISPELIWGIFVSDVMPYVLAEKKIDVLHSSAFVLDGSGVAFVGYPGSGKSTLAAYFLKEGFPLLADDRLPFVISREGIWAIPGFPGIRICEDVRKLCFGNIVEKLPKICAEGEKRFFYFGANNRVDGLRFQADPVFLRRVYILKPGSDEISITPLSPKDAFFSMMPHIFDSKKPIEFLFHDKGAFVQSVQIRLLNFPRGFCFLPAVFRAIKDDCEADLFCGRMAI